MSQGEIHQWLAETFGFENQPNPNQKSSEYVKIDLYRREFSVSTLLFGLMKHLGCQPEQTFEKIAWMYSFSVQGQTCILSSEKFGLRLYVPMHVSDRFHTSVQKMLKFGLKKYSNLLQEQIDNDILGLHDFGITNQTSFLRRGYELFRSKAQEAYDLGKHKGEKTVLFDGPVTSISFNQEPWWYSFGATVAYFSYLEHLYSGLFAFTGKRHTATELHHFISLKWRDKHRTLLEEAGVFETGQFNRLLSIFDQQRNPFSHGLGGKKLSSVYRLIPDVGFVPSKHNKQLVQPNLRFSEEHQEVFLENCRVFDDFDNFLSKSPLSHGIEWAKSGMNFRFDSKFMDEMEAAVAKGEFREFLEWQGYLHDKAANFE